ncbi:unnamed protein product [Lactuca saligna]|uniref:Uncharacterized protein n=1 Tax=Lactuca saligna TaxID=75948 RepID=A0AA36E5Y6_LACSI|nr:unnamed protein product [Lactuca saligna]
MAKEVEKMEKNYIVLHSKVDIVADAIVKLVEFNTDYSTKLEVKSEQDFKIKVFIDNYFACLAITDIELSMDVNKTSKVPQSLLKGKDNIGKFEDVEIIHQPFGVVFRGKTRMGR